MIKHSDYTTHIRNEEDKDVLTRRLFEVNMRLYGTSPIYKAIVDGCCQYIQWGATTTKDGYKKPHGFSGANAGIPFNIIGLADGTVIINPEIAGYSGEKISWTNCGSLTLEKPIKVRRYAQVTVQGIQWGGADLTVHPYYDKTGYLPTHQHEIDHNNGVLITDREVKNEGEGSN